MKNKTRIIIAVSSFVIITLALVLLLTSCDNKKAEEVSLNDNLCSYKLNALVEEDYEAENCAGYKVANEFIFTKNIDQKKAIEALKPYMVFYDGEPVHTDSNIVVNINNNRADVSCTFPDGKVSHVNTGIQVIDSPDGVEFAAVTPYEFFRYACVIEKSTCPSGYDVSKTPYYANTAWYHNLRDPQFDLDYNDSLQEECETWSSCVFRTGNGKYHLAKANVRILDGLCADGFTGSVNNKDSYQAPASTQSPDNTSKDNPEESNFFDTVKDKVEEIKENNKQAFDIATIIISSVLGIALLYILFLIIRKIWRSLKR